LSKKNLIIRNLVDKKFLNLFSYNGSIIHYVLNYFNTSSWKKISYILKLEVLKDFKTFWSFKYKNLKLSKKIKFFLKKLNFKKQIIKKRFLKSNFKKQIFNKHFCLKSIIFKRINILFSRFFLYLNKHNISHILNSNKDYRKILLTNVKLNSNNKVSFYQSIKSIYFVLNKRIYNFNNSDNFPIEIFNLFKSSSLYYLRNSLDHFSFNVSNIYTKFLKFYFRKFKSRKLFNLRRFWFSNTKKLRYSRKSRLKFRKFSSLYLLFPSGFRLGSKLSPRFRFKRPRFLRKIDFWGFKRKLGLHKLAKVQLGFFYRSKFLQYSKISRLKHYIFSFGLVYDRLYLLFFLQLIYYFINNSIRYFKYVSIIYIYLFLNYLVVSYIQLLLIIYIFKAHLLLMQLTD